MLTLLLAGCGGGMSSQPVASSAQQVQRGITYRLPETALDLVITWDLSGCTFDSGTGKTTLTATMDVTTTTRVVDGEEVALVLDGGLSADTDVKVTFHANTGRVATLGSTATDRSAQIAANVVKGVAGIATALATGGVLHGAGGQPTGAGVQVCTAAAIRAIRRAAEIEAALPAARERDSRSVGPLDVRVTQAATAEEAARTLLADARSFGNDEAVRIAQRRFDRAVAGLDAARSARSAARPEAARLTDELDTLRRDTLRVTRRITDWRPGRGEGTAAWRRESPLTLAAIRGRWVTDDGLCRLDFGGVAGDEAASPCAGDRLVAPQRLSGVHVVALKAVLAIRGANSATLPLSGPPPAAPGLLIRRPASARLVLCRADCTDGQASNGEELGNEAVTIAQAGTFTVVPLVVGMFGDRTINVTLAADGTPAEFAMRDSAPGAAAAAGFAAVGESIASGTSAVMQAIEARRNQLRTRAENARSDEKAVLEAEITRLDNERRIETLERIGG